MSRTPLIAANWKMHRAPEGALDAGSAYFPMENVDTIVFPCFLDLVACVEAGLLTGPQYGHQDDHGAHTGDISLQMAKDLGCQFALCGHSERRAHHHETNEEVGAQVQAALHLGLTPVACVGETWEERKASNAEAVIEAQLQALPLDASVIVAYEPVWAISGGDPSKPAASAEEAQKMHAFIRSLLPDQNMRILYGGSMKPENAEELLAQPDIDGGLVGGASLVPEKFGAIVHTASERA